MRLYVCWTTRQTFGPGHPCANALEALRAAGYAPEVVKSRGWGLLPAVVNRSAGRREARRRTGRSWVPLLVTDADETVAGTEAIRAWAAAHPRPRR